MDQDFFIEETSPFKIIFYVLIFVGLIGGGIYYYLNYKNSNHLKLKDVTIELGSKLPQDKETYIETNNPSAYTIDLSMIKTDEEGNVNSAGEYSYKVKGSGETKKGKVYVKDTTKPTVEIEDLVVGVSEEFSPNDYLKKCEDYSLPCSVKFKNSKDLEINTKEGIFSTTIIISDAAGNELTKDVKLTVKGENTLGKKKAADLEYSYIEEPDPNWNNTYTLKLTKAVPEDSIEYNDYIVELSSKEYKFSKTIKERKMIVVFNRYKYVIGFSTKITFEDDSFIYVTKSNAEEIITEE